MTHYAIAQEPAPAPAKPATTGGGPMGFDVVLMLFVPLVLMYFVFLRPAQKRQEQEKQALASGLTPNDRVLTTAGIHGTVVRVNDKEDEVVVRVDDNVKLRMIRAAIAKNFSLEERVKAEKEAAKAGKK